MGGKNMNKTLKITLTALALALPLAPNTFTSAREVEEGRAPSPSRYEMKQTLDAVVEMKRSVQMHHVINSLKDIIRKYPLANKSVLKEQIVNQLYFLDEK
jgi:hypothetical protein